jgi:protoporphyrinogen/coproporphyrinogen III oxidase
VKVVVVGGGIAGLAAARRLEQLLAGVEVVLVERESRLGGKLRTERGGGFVVEGAADSFLSRKARGVGLAEELGLGDELVGRRPGYARSFVKVNRELHQLPEGLTGMIPTNLDALAESALLTPDGRERLAAEAELAPEPELADESIASFVTRRLGPEAYERLVEPLMTGIYGGDGERLSLAATFPNLRALELEHGSVLRGLAAQPTPAGGRPPFLSLRGGMETLSEALVASLERTRVMTGRAATGIRGAGRGFVVDVHGAEALAGDGVVVALPAFAAAELLAEVDAPLAEDLAAIPYASSAIVTLALVDEDLVRPLDGYGYVVPRASGSDVLACTWSSSKWEERAPAGFALVRVYAGRFGGRDVMEDTDDELVALAREELRTLGIAAEPARTWIHRWPGGMPQYVLGHLERLARIEAAVARRPGLALAGAAYRGVGIPDCIASGEAAAESVAVSVAGLVLDPK